jgi:hypothetical protein
MKVKLGALLRGLGYPQRGATEIWEDKTPRRTSLRFVQVDNFIYHPHRGRVK